jgi:ABC-type branched-subunit amino acid transport system substrate-binding protein
MVGSMSAFDSGGAATAQSCGLPDIRAASTTSDRQACTTCFAAESANAYEFQNAVPDFVLKNYGDAGDHAAMLYINAGAAAENGKTQAAAMEKRGMHFDYVQGIDIAEFNYAPYVQQMKDKGIKLVNYTGPYQNTVKLLDAMKQQGFEPDVYIQDSTIYDERFVEEAGTKLFDDYGVKEMALYRSWLDQVKPGAVPNYFGLYAWSAARLFVEQAVALGGKLTRAAMVDALSKVRNWTGNGVTAPQQVGAKTTANCQSILQLDGGKWSQVSPGDFLCAPLIDSGEGN